MSEPKFTVKEIQEYFNGWTDSESPNEHTPSTTWNGHLMLDDDQDGIVSYFERKTEIIK